MDDPEILSKCYVYFDSKYLMINAMFAVAFEGYNDNIYLQISILCKMNFTLTG